MQVLVVTVEGVEEVAEHSRDVVRVVAEPGLSAELAVLERGHLRLLVLVLGEGGQVCCLKDEGLALSPTEQQYLCLGNLSGAVCICAHEVSIVHIVKHPLFRL